MHSSKGLEWPVVILINTVGRVDRRDEFFIAPTMTLCIRSCRMWLRWS